MPAAGIFNKMMRSFIELLQYLVSFIVSFYDSRGFAPEEPRYPDDGGILLHNPQLCRSSSIGHQLDWVVYVHTSPTHRRRRDLLRQTWANVDLFKQLHFRVVFLLGRPPPADSPKVQARRAVSVF